MENTLLVVDDDSFNLTQLLQILQPDYKIYAVKDGMSAINKAEKSLPDLILLDIHMPGMSGFDVISKLKLSENAKDIPVIFISGMRNEEIEAKGLALGAVDFIRKPFDPTVVKLRVRNQIQIVNMRKELRSIKERL